MKTKYLLTALALAGGFAACTQEDVLVEQGNLQSKVIEKSLGKLTFNVTGDVESRMTGANWDNQDILGLMWFNPSYQVGEEVTEMGNGMLWANNPFYFVEGSQSDFASKTNVMEGTHIAYYPYQTAWGDDKLQQIAGKEYLNIYASAEQQTNLTDRYDWMREHTNMFSKVHELTGDKAGLSKTNEIAMKQFNNIITVTPYFENMPADLTVTRYYFEANGAKVFPTKAIVDPYAGENGDVWPRMQKDFLNGWTGFTQLDEIYDPQEMVKTVAVNYPEAVAYTDANGKGFGFTLLPVAEGDLKNTELTGYGAVTAAHGITLYAETNYGIIPVTEVTVRMDDKMDGAIEEIATWNKIFYGADNCTIPTDWERYGLVGKAGYTVQTKAVFDFENIIPQTEFTCIGNNAELDAALERIATYKTLLGAKYDAATINLCDEVEFTTFGEDGDFWAYIDANDSEVDITVQGNGKTVIDWIGKHYLSKEIEGVALNKATAAETRAAAEGVELPAGKYFTQPWDVYGSLLLNGTHYKGNYITVKAGGYLKVNGAAGYVQVEGLGEGLNLGQVNNLKVAENGKFTNGSTAATAETAPEIIINKLWNKGKVVNFTTIESVEENTESATIELKKAKGKNLFQIGQVAWYYGGQKPAALRYNELPTIEESVKSIGKIFAKVATDASIDAAKQSYQAGEDVLKAMENFANEVIISAAAVDFRNHTSVARRNCLYNVMYTNLVANGEVEFITDNRLTASVLLVRKMTVNKGKSLKLTNFNDELADFAYSVAAYIALSTELNAGSTLYINGQTVLVAPALIVEGTGATLDGKNKAKSIIYSLPLNASGFNVTSNVTLNSVGDFDVDALIDSVINGILY